MGKTHLENRSNNYVHYPNADATNPQRLDTYLDTLNTGKIGGSTGGTDNRVLRSDGTGGITLQNSAITVDDAGAMSGITTLSCTDLSPTNALPINKGGTANTTATAAFDALAPTTTRGDLIVRGASNNVRLALGTSGKFLTSDGTDASWGASLGITGLASGSLSGTNVTITGISAAYAYLTLVIAGASSDTATRILRVQVSTDNGASYDTTAANYVGYLFSAAASGANTVTATPNLLGNIGSVAAAATQTAIVSLFSYQGGAFPYAPGMVSQSTPNTWITTNYYVGSSSAINALKILWDASGNFDAGTYNLYGIR